MARTKTTYRALVFRTRLKMGGSVTHIRKMGSWHVVENLRRWVLKQDAGITFRLDGLFDGHATQPISEAAQSMLRRINARMETSFGLMRFRPIANTISWNKIDTRDYAPTGPLGIVYVGQGSISIELRPREGTNPTRIPGVFRIGSGGVVVLSAEAREHYDHRVVFARDSSDDDDVEDRTNFLQYLYCEPPAEEGPVATASRGGVKRARDPEDGVVSG